MTTEDFILPDIGEGIVECEVVEWLVNEGDVVQEDQPVADVQTDKALVQIPAKHAGKITKIYVQQGDVAKVHAPLFQLDVSTSTENNKAVESQPEITPATLANQPASIQQTVQPSQDNRRKVLATPAVRRIAREHHIDLSEVTGSGRNGRVLKEDMLKLIEPTAKAQVIAAEHSVQTSSIETIEITGIRARMAEQMVRSVSTIPHFTYAEEIDITQCNAQRRALNDSLPEDQPRLTLMAFFIKALSLALLQHPLVNSRMSDDGKVIHQHAEHNIGMAVDSPVGLLVPNVKAVNRLSLMQVAVEIKRLTELGRAGRLPPEDMNGGTITVSNIGAIGGTVTTPIINAPEVAIVGIGRLQKLPRVTGDDTIEIREVITVSWSGDHRVLDGGAVAKFNNDWKNYLESPQNMLLHMR